MCTTYWFCRMLRAFIVAIVLTLPLVGGSFAATQGSFSPHATWSIDTHITIPTREVKARGANRAKSDLVDPIIAKMGAEGMTVGVQAAAGAVDEMAYDLKASSSGSIDDFRRLIHKVLKPDLNILGGVTEMRIISRGKQPLTSDVVISANPSTGYVWTVVNDNGLSEEAPTEFVMHTRGLGVPEHQVLHLRHGGVGSNSIKLVYRRPWESVAATVSLTLELDALPSRLDLSDPEAPVGPVSPMTEPISQPVTAAVFPVVAASTLPLSWDWRNSGIVTPIRDQGGCGSCWAFGTVGVMESALGKNGISNVNLSEQFLVSCNTAGWGCGGGLTAHMFHEYQPGNNQTEAGAVLETDMSYTGTDSSCTQTYNHPYKLSAWQFITPTENDMPTVEQIKSAIYTNGPVTAGVCESSGWSNYRGGIFSTDESSHCGTGVNHQIILVGWDDNGGNGYWILRNSWGTSWGMGGYMYISYNISRVGQGTSWVATTDPIAPTITEITPYSMPQGANGQTLTINGTNLTGATINISGTDVTLGTPTVTATRIDVPVTVSTSALIGDRTISVDTAGGRATATFTVTDSPTTILFSNGMESMAGWSTIIVSPTFISPSARWSIISSGSYPPAQPHSGVSMAQFKTPSSTANSQARLFRTSGFTIPSSAGMVTLKYWMYHETTVSAIPINVQACVSTDGSTFNTVGLPVFAYSGATGWTEEVVDLTPYKGQTNVQIGFIGTSTHYNSIYIDDVSVEALSETAPNFIVTAAPSVLSVLQGGTSTSTIATTISGGFNNIVDLTVSGMPSGVTATFIPATITYPGSGSSNLILTADSTAAVGSYPVTVTGTSGGMTRKCAFLLTVKSFTLTATPAMVTLAQGGAETSILSTTVSGGFNNAVTLTASGLPTGVTASFSPEIIGAPGAGSAIMTFTAATTAVTGTYTVTVVGSGDGATKTTNVTLTVTDSSTTILFSDGLESMTGWSILEVAGLWGRWGINVSGANPPALPHGGSSMAQFNSWYASSGDQARLFRSSGIAIPNTTGLVTLKFWMYHDTGWGSCSDQMQAQASIDGTTWNNVGAPLLRYNGSNGWAEASIDLSAYRGQPNVQLGFLGTSANGNNIYLDDVSVMVSGGTIPTFSLIVAPMTLSLVQGGEGTSTIATAITGGFNSDVALTAAGLPAGVTAAFSPMTIAAPGTGNATLTLTAASTVVAGNYPITITGSGGGMTKQANLILTIMPLPTFTMSAYPTSVSVVQQGTGTSIITTTVSGGFNGAVALTASGLPAGVSAAFYPVAIPAPGSGSATLTFTVASTAVAGSYPVTVTATGGGVTRQATVTVTVTQRPTFTLFTSQMTLSMAQGDARLVTIATSVSGGFNNAIALTVTGLPAGVVAAFDSATIAAPGSGMTYLIFRVNSAAVAGSYPVTITSTGGGVTQTATITLMVTMTPSFTLTATPTIVSVAQGETGTSTITTTASGGFSSGITLSISGLPPGVTAVFVPATIDAPGAGSSTLTFTADLTAVAGIYPVTVTATGGGVTQQTTITVIVSPRPTFTLIASPTPVSMVQGWQGTSTITTTVSGGYNSTVAFTASGLPIGVTAEFSPAAISTPGAGSSILTFTAASTAMAGSYPVTITGVGGGTTRQTTVTLTVTSIGNGSITTTFTGVNYSMNGNMFDVVAVSGPLTLTKFDLHLADVAGSTSIPVNVYYKNGSYAGSEQNPGAWTLLNSYVVTSAGSGNPTSMPINGLTIPTGQVYGIYITRTDGFDLKYSSGANTYSDAHIQVNWGAGVAYPFGTAYTPRTWNGTIYYTYSALIPDFALTASPDSVSLVQGGTGTTAITTTVSGGFNSGIYLTATSLPAGVTAAFTPTTIAAPGTGGTTLIFTADSTAVAGSYPVTITATGGGVTQQTTFTVTVTLCPTFALNTAPVTVPMIQGGTGTTAITTTVSGGFNSPVALAASGLPPGVTAAFTPITISAPGSGSAALTFTADSTAGTGNYPVTVMATGGGVTQKAIITITITAGSLESGSISTTFAGGTSSSGNMFDVSALSGPLTLTKFDLHLAETAGTTSIPVNVYYKSGTYVGSEGTPNAWTLLNSYTVTSAGAGNPTSLPIDNLTIPAGQVYGIYITRTDGFSLVYSPGANTFSDAHIQINTGAGIKYPFGSAYTPRVWNGTIYYTYNALVPAFALTASPGSVPLVQGGTGISTLTTTVLGGFTSSVALTASGLPTGVTAVFAPATIPTPGAGVATLTFSADSTAGAGSYPVTITATGSGATRQITVNVTVTMLTTFAMTAAPSSLSVVQGGTANSTMATTVSGGFSSAVTLSVSGLPTGVTAAFAPATIPAPGIGSSHLTFIVDSTALVGSYPVTIIATGGGVTQKGLITITVTAGLPGSGSISTTFAGGVSYPGNMFDVTALSTPLTIAKFDLHLAETAGTASIPVRIYYKSGTYVGSEGTPNAWTLLNSYTVTSAGAGNPTSLPIDNLTIPAGQVYGIYISRTDGFNLEYSVGAHTYYNATIQITLGAGLLYPFSTGFSPRTWNGTIYYTAAPPPPTFFTILTSTGANGTVTASQTVNYGTNSTVITVTPNANYHISSVLVDGVSQPFTDPKSFSTNFTNVTANHTVSATFAIDTFSIAVSSGGNGTLTGTAAQSVNYGGSATVVSALATTGYHFVNWTGTNGFVTTTANPLTVSNVTGAMVITANFAIDSFTIATSAGANGSVSPSQTVTYGANSSAITVTPSVNYHITAVLVDGVSQTITDPKSFSTGFINVTANHTVAATFAIDTFTVTFSSGGNGTLTGSPAQSVNYGGSATVASAVAATGYHFVNWTGTNGFVTTTINPLTVSNVTGAMVITANFAIDTFTISTSAGASGTVTPGQTVSYGASSTAITVTSNANYHIAAVLVDGVSQTIADSKSYGTSFSNVTSNHTVSASFGIDSFSVTFSSGGNGTLTGSPAQSVNYGSSATVVSAVAATGYHFVNWTGANGFVTTTVNPLTVSYVTSAIVITANFSIDTFAITTSAGINGTVSSSQTVNYGGNSAAITVTPNANYHIALIFVDGISQTVNDSKNYSTSFNNVTANHTILATFAIDTFTIIASAGQNGAVTPSQTVNYGNNSVAITVTPNVNYHICAVLVDGVSQSITNPKSYSTSFSNIMANHTVSATFAADTFTIIFSSGNNGFLTGNTTQNVTYGESSTPVTVAPDSGYHFVNWTGTGGFVTNSATSLTVNNVTIDMILTANFAQDIYYSLNLTISGNGTVNSKPSGFTCGNGICLTKYLSGTLLSLMATLSADSTIATWSGACSGSKECNLTINGDKNIIATFTAAPKVKVNAMVFGTLTEAYNHPDTTNGSFIRMLDGIEVGPLVANKMITVTLSGGQNAAYEAQPGSSIIKGSCIVQKGTVIMNRMTVK